MRGLVALLLVMMMAGCTQDSPLTKAPAEPTVYVGPPEEGGGAAPCAPQSAQQAGIDVQGVEIRDAGHRAPGIYRVDATRWIWVWESYHDTERQDKVARVNEVQVFHQGGESWLCTRVELVAPTFVDGARSTYDVAVQYDLQSPLPPGPIHWTVNWIAGCSRCDPPPSGNATADFG